MNRQTWIRVTASAGAVALLPACATSGSQANTPSQSPSPATDLIEIVRTRWEVRPGMVVPIRTFGGSVPGKTLRYRVGESVVIRVVNHSGERQAIHWHGLIVPDTVDGTPDLGTPPVEPTASRDYRFVVRPAGSRWYHSHMGEGLFSGMYGALIVEDPLERRDYDREVVLMLGAFGPHIPTQESMSDDHPPGSPRLTMPVMSGDGMMMAEMSNQKTSMSGSMGMDSMTGANMGMRDARFSAFGINGKALGDGEPLRVKHGERIRLRIYNASPTKTFRLALPGHRFEVTHLDGYPVPRPRYIDALELGVAERIDAIVTMDAPGIWILGSTVAAERTDGLGIVIAYDGARGKPEWRDTARDVFRYTDFGREAATEPRAEQTDLILRKSSASRDAWSINGKLYPHTDELLVSEGRAYRVRFENHSMMEHPMHLHGHGFELASVDGVATAGIIKDTVTVRPMGGVVEVLVRADNPYRGRFLLHCHNEQHMTGGMATVVRYV